MELKNINIDQIKKIKGENAIVLISNGQMKCLEMPSYGIVEIISKDGKVKRIKEQQEVLF